MTLAVNSASKLEGDSGSKLKDALLLGTRCHCINTSSENMKSCVCPLDVTCWGVNLKVTLAVNVKVTLAVNSASKLEGDSGSGSKLEGDPGSKLESALLLVGGGKLELDTSSENMNSFQVLLLHHRGLFYKRPTMPKKGSITK